MHLLLQGTVSQEAVFFIYEAATKPVTVSLCSDYVIYHTVHGMHRNMYELY